MIGKICGLLSSRRLDIDASIQGSREMQAEALRKLALAEWLIKMEARRLAMEEPNQVDMTVGRLTWLVEQRKLQLATAEESSPHLMAAVPPPLASSEGRLERFDIDYYLELPGPVVRERLLSFVEDPPDMLNLLEVIPTEAKYTDRTTAELQFELEFPEMLRNRRVSWDINEEDEDRVNPQELASISKHHRKVILKNFENFLVNDIENNVREPVGGSIYLDRLPYFWVDDTEIDQLITFPETRQVFVAAVLRQDEKTVGNGASAVWDFRIAFNQAMSLNHACSNLCWYLSYMSNLRRMCVTFCSFYEELKELEDYRSESLVFPSLPCLRSLQFCDWDDPDLFPLCKMLLEKYGRQLNKLYFEIFDQMANIPVDLPSCPKLTILVINVMRPDWFGVPQISSGMALRLLSNFEMAPLKVLKVDMNESRMRAVLYNLLEYCSLKFGGTLEHLEVNCGGRWFSDIDTESPPASHTSLKSVRLPKLKHFGTNIDPRPDGWGFLLLLPSLETLQVHPKARREGEQENGQNQDETLNDRESIMGSRLWKRLPKLQTIELKYIATVTREQALNSQQSVR